jgi:secernin
MCDTFVALPDATADASVLLGKNSDREPNEAHELVLLPAAHHRGGDSVTATYRTIPQARHTHAALLAKPYWIWGAEMGVNEHGVAIGNEAVFTTAKHEREPGLLGMDLLRLGLERGANADEAAAVICEHLQRYGQSGKAGHTHNLQYDNSFLIADPHGALVLETVGRDWVIEQVRHTRSISNGLTIHEDWDRASVGLSRPGVDIARQHSDLLYTRFSDSRARQCRTTEALQRQRGAITVADAMALLRDHGERGGRPDFTPASGVTGMTVCAHAGPGPIRNSQSVGSMVAHISPGATTVWATATSATCLSAYKPIWLAAGLPALGPQPGAAYDPAALWWRHEDLHRAVLADYTDRAPIVRRVVADLEEQFAAWARDADPGQRAEVTRRSFAAADEALMALLPEIRQRPIRRRTPPLYTRAWRAHDREAQR